jgi:hypothetical protein
MLELWHGVAMARREKSELSADERRLIAYALCALVEATAAEHQAELQIDASALATKLGLLTELALALSAGPPPKAAVAL